MFGTELKPEYRIVSTMCLQPVQHLGGTINHVIMADIGKSQKLDHVFAVVRHTLEHIVSPRFEGGQISENTFLLAALWHHRRGVALCQRRNGRAGSCRHCRRADQGRCRPRGGQQNRKTAYPRGVIRADRRSNCRAAVPGLRTCPPRHDGAGV